MIPFRLALRNLRLHWGRSLLAILGIIVGVAAISSMGLIGSSLHLSIAGSLAAAGDTIVITPHGSATPDTSNGAGSLHGITEHQVEAIRQAAGRNTVIPLRSVAERITSGGEAGTVGLYAMDPADVPALLGKESGAYLKYGSGVMVGAKLAEENNLRVGETLGIGPGEERVRIVGILRERGVGFDISPDEAVIVPDTWFTSRYGATDYSEVIVRVGRPGDIDSVKAAIEAQLNPRERVVNVLDTRRVLGNIQDSFSEVSAIILSAGAISLAIAGLSLLSVMLLSVGERRREIGILRALGAKRGQVMRIFLSEALILGLVGSCIGAILSLAGWFFAVSLMLHSAGSLFSLSTLGSLLSGAAFGIGIAFLSGIYPAWKAAMMNPAEALRSG